MANYQLQILHASDLEGGVEAIGNAPNFAAVMAGLEGAYANTVRVSAGDNYLPGPFFAASGDPALAATLQSVYERFYGLPEGSLSGLEEGEGRVDISIMNLLEFDASALGNHEFDLGTGTLAGIIGADVASGEDATGALSDIAWLGAQFPYLSANLDFTGDPNVSGLFTDEVLPSTAFAAPDGTLAEGGDPTAADTPKIAPSTIVERGGEQIGVVGATTPLLNSISSPGDTEIVGPTGNDMQALAAVIQPAIDGLTAEGVDKIVLTTHLQQIQLEQELVPLLRGVDVSIAGGSDTLLADDEDVGRGLQPGDAPAGAYPIVTENADGDPAAIVSTDGEYSYVGRLVVEFDENGVLVPGSVDPNVSGAFATTAEGVEAVYADDPAAAFADGSKGALVRELVEGVRGVVNEQDGTTFGSTEVFLEGRREEVRTEETNLGNLSADANLFAAREADETVRVSIKNGGGIRNPIGEVLDDGSLAPPPANPEAGKEEGEVSQLDIANSLRFNNALANVTLTTEQLLEVLEHAVSATEPGATPGQFAQVGGIRFSFDPEGTPREADPDTFAQTVAGDRVRSVALQTEDGPVTLVENGEVVDGAPATVRVTTLSFLADGGDGYPFPVFAEANGGAYDRVDLAGEEDEDLNGNGAIDGPALTEAGAATFADPGTEQDALAEYLAAEYADTPFAEADTPPAEDERVQNLAERDDTVLDGAGDGDGDGRPGDGPPDDGDGDGGDGDGGTPDDGGLPDGVTAIYAIQGAAHASPLVGQEVTTRGVVTAVDGNGFYLQDARGDGDDATSDAVFVFTRAAPDVEVGRRVEVSGTVSEFTPGGASTGNLSTTQVTAAGAIRDLGAADLPSAVVIGDAGRAPPTEVIEDDNFESFDPETDGIDFYESLEATRVTVDDARAVSGTTFFGELYTAADDGEGATNLSERGTLNIEGGAPNPGGTNVFGSAGDDDLDPPAGDGAPTDDDASAEGDGDGNNGNGDGDPGDAADADFNPERVQIDADAEVSPDGFAIPEVNTGARLGDVTGVLGYNFGNFEVVPTETFEADRGGEVVPETTELAGDHEALTVASYNVLNLDPNVEDVANVADQDEGEIDDDVADGRFATIAQQIAGNMGAPDVVALQEIQDNNGAEITDVTAADETLQTLVDAIADAGGPTYEFIDNPFIGNETSGGQPGGNIRTALLYNPDRVDLVEGSVRTITDPAEQRADGAAFDEGDDYTPDLNPFADSRLPLAADFVFGDETVTVVSNHFTSKGGSDPLFGARQDPDQGQPANGGEAQRVAQAEAVGGFVAELKAGDPDANVVVAGDLNEFEFEEPLRALTGGGELINLTETLPEDERYSYVFEGNSQSLDHVLVSGNLEDGAAFDPVHVNAEFAATDALASDHDPLVARIGFGDDPVGAAARLTDPPRPTADTFG